MKHGWLVIAGFVTVGGFVLKLLDFQPKLIASAHSALDPNDPISMQFVIQNDGKLPLFSVRGGCLVKKVEHEKLEAFKGSGIYLVPQKVLENTEPRFTEGTESFFPGEMFTIGCADVLGRMGMTPGKDENDNLRARILQSADVPEKGEIILRPISADILLHIHYKTSPWSDEMVQEFRYATKTTVGGQIVWFPEPVVNTEHTEQSRKKIRKGS